MMKRTIEYQLASAVFSFFLVFVVNENVCYGAEDADKKDEAVVAGKGGKRKIRRGGTNQAGKGKARARGSKKKSTKRVATEVAKLGKFDQVTGDINSFKTAANNLKTFITTKLADASKAEAFDLYKGIGIFKAMVGRSKFATEEHYNVVNDLLKVAVDNSSKFKMKQMAKNIAKWQKAVLNESTNKDLQKEKLSKEETFKKTRAERKAKIRAEKQEKAAKKKDAAPTTSKTARSRVRTSASGAKKKYDAKKGIDPKTGEPKDADDSKKLKKDGKKGDKKEVGKDKDEKAADLKKKGSKPRVRRSNAPRAGKPSRANKNKGKGKSAPVEEKSGDAEKADVAAK